MSAASHSITVVVEEKAFMSLILSAIESFPTKYSGSRRPAGAPQEGEVSGLLFGQRTITSPGVSVINVTLALPSTMFENRTKRSITTWQHNEDKILKAASRFPSYKFLGGYHSHLCNLKSFSKVKSILPSGADKSAIEDKVLSHRSDMIEVILGLTYLQRRVNKPAERIAENIISSRFGNYKYSLAAYYSRYTDGNATEVTDVDSLICKTATGY